MGFDAFVASTECAAQSLVQRHHPLAPEPFVPIDVVPLGVGRLEALRSSDVESTSQPPAAPSFVVFGDREPPPACEQLLRLWDTWSECVPGALLHVIGNEPSSARETELVRAGRLLRHRNASDADVVTLLGDARAVLAPSFAEGYGLLLREVAALGVPVLTSDIPVYRTIAGTVLEYVGAPVTADVSLAPFALDLERVPAALDRIPWLQALTDYALDTSRSASHRARLAGQMPRDWSAHFSSLDRIVGVVGIGRIDRPSGQRTPLADPPP